MRPSSLILGALIAAGWFVGLPFAAAYGSAGDHISLLGAYAMLGGVTVAVLAFVVVLIALDKWWDRRSRA